MWSSNLFKLSEKPNPEIVDLLTEVTLGTTGVRYKHLDTAKRVTQIDHPLFFYIQRQQKVLGNITFCRRNQDWYIRYFAFRTSLQRSTDTKTEDKSNSLLKTEIERFFQSAINGDVDGNDVSHLYAYIDPKNDRSKWMSRNFNFQTVAQLSTQTFSRLFARKSSRFKIIDATDNEMQQRIRQVFQHHAFFFEYYLDKDPFAVIENEQGEIVAFSRISTAHWHIESLGGKWGEQKAKLVSKLPVLNRLVNLEKHTFVVPDSVWIKDNDPVVLTELFESLIAHTQANMLIWWVDNKELLYQETKYRVKWGPLHPILGVSQVDVVCRSKTGKAEALTNPLYVVAIDAI